MSILAPGNPISFCDILCEYGGKYGDTALNVCVNNYYAQTTSCLVEPCTFGTCGVIPSSGQISISQFYSSPVGFTNRDGVSFGGTEITSLFIDTDCTVLLPNGRNYGARDNCKSCYCGLVRIKCNGYIDSSFLPGRTFGQCTFTICIVGIRRYDSNHYIVGGKVDYRGSTDYLSHGILKLCNNGCVSKDFKAGLITNQNCRWQPDTFEIHPNDASAYSGMIYMSSSTSGFFRLIRLCCNGCQDRSFCDPLFDGTTGTTFYKLIFNNDRLYGFGNNAGVCAYCTNGCRDTSVVNVFGGVALSTAAACDSTFIVSGTFCTCSRCGIAKICSNGHIMTNWGTTSGIKQGSNVGAVRTIHNDPYSKMTYIAGVFNCVNGVQYLGFARLCSNGAVDTSFCFKCFGGGGFGCAIPLRPIGIGTFPDCSIIVYSDRSILCYNGIFVSNVFKLCFNGCIDRAY
jgi:hypothetical protein